MASVAILVRRFAIVQAKWLADEIFGDQEDRIALACSTGHQAGHRLLASSSVLPMRDRQELGNSHHHQTLNSNLKYRGYVRCMRWHNNPGACDRERIGCEGEEIEAESNDVSWEMAIVDYIVSVGTHDHHDRREHAMNEEGLEDPADDHDEDNCASVGEAC